MTSAGRQRTHIADVEVVSVSPKVWAREVYPTRSAISCNAMAADRNENRVRDNVRRAIEATGDTAPWHLQQIAAKYA